MNKNVEAEINIKSTPAKILSAFTDSQMLKDWWGVERNLIQLKPGGLYALAWSISESGFGFISTGIVREYIANYRLLIDDFVYFNPERSMLEPMSLLIRVNEGTRDSKLYICQDGYQEGGDWDWYYHAVLDAWPKALKLIKNYLEKLPE